MSSKERSQGSASSSSPRWAGLAIALLLSLLLPGVAQASHYYGGQISWERVSGSTVNITLTTVWRSNFIGSATIDFGDGNTAFSGSPPGAFQGMFTPPTSADTYSVYEQTFTHTYAGNGPFLVGISGCCRPGSVTNAANGDHVLQTLVDLSGGAFGSPAIDPSSVFGVGMRAGVTSGFTMSVADPAAEPITCSLSADPFPNVGYVIPPGLAVDPDSCVVTWDTAGTSVGQWYVFAVKAQNPSGNYALLDTWVEITGGTNTAPTCTGGSYQAAVGQTRSIAVEGIDPEGADLTAGLLSPIPGSTLTPGSGASPLTTTLAWTPTLADVGTATTTVAFFDADNRLGSCAVSVTVSVDDPPTCTSPGAVTVDPGQPVAMDFVGTDPEGAILTSVAGTLPPGSAFGPTSGSSPLTSTFSWTPTLADAGTWSISATFSDPPANQAVCTDTVTVTTCVDADGDGVGSCAGDCDDTDPGRYPGAPEICGDGTIQDCDATVDDICPPAGTGAIVEVMANPTGADPTGEWFEMLVAAGTPTFDLLGFEVCDLASNCFTIDTPTDASGGDRIVFGRPADLNVGFSGPVVVASNITLNNGGDTLTVTAPDGSVTATLNYDAAGFPSVSAGSSIQLDPSFIDEQTGSNWNTTPTGTTYGTTGAENGTPGAANVDVNQAPVAVSDILTVLEDAAAAVVNVVANDTDVDGDTLTVLSVGTPSQGGSASVVSGELVYAPGPDVNGTETVSYVVTDGALTDTATLTITITPVNDAPVAVPDAGTVAEDAAGTLFDVITNDTDVEGDTLSLWLVGAVSAGGVASRVGDMISYTPAPNYTGIETVEYRVRDGNGGSALGTLTVTVTPVNDAPVAVADTATVAEDAAATSIDVVANDTDIDGDTLSLTAVGTPDQGGAASVSGGQLLYTPAANFNGTETVSYTVSDGALTDTGTVTVTVTPVNDAPVAVPDTATVAEDSVGTLLDVITNDTDVDGDTLSLWLIGSVSAGGQAQRVGDMISYSPAANFNGTETVGYRVRDGNGGSALGVITITVTPVNDAPVAVADTATVAEDAAPTSIDVIANDTDLEGDALSLTAVGTPDQGGAASMSGGQLVYTPAADFNGAETVSYVVSDGALTTTGSLTITVTPVNDPPVAVPDTATVAEDSAGTLLDVITNDTDIDGDTLSLWLIGSVSAGGLAQRVSDMISYSPAANFNGTETVGYRVRDGNGGSALGVITVTVTSVNDAPVAAAGGPYTADEGAAVALDGSGSSDLDGSVVTWEWDCDGDGTYEISSAAATGDTCSWDDEGTPTIALRVTDDGGLQAVATATATVSNVSPTLAALAAAQGPEGSAIGLSASATDPGVNDVLTYTWDFGDGSSGTGASPTATYATAGTYTVSVTVSDGDGGQDTTTGTVVVTDVAPAVTSLTGDATLDEGSAGTWTAAGEDAGSATGLVFAWDFGDGGSQTAVTTASHTYADDGVFTLAVTVTDDEGSTASSTLAVTVANVAPVIAGSPAATALQDIPWTYAPTATDPGADTLSWSLVSAPAAMQIDAGTGAITWTPTYADSLVGSFTFDVLVDDGDGGSDSQSVTILVASADTDGDGMSDGWETANGLDPSDATDAALDPDADGLTNLDEFQGGTDPAVFDGPGLATLVAPIQGDEVGSASPTLVWDNAADPQNDAITYAIEVYADSALLTLLTSASGLAEDASGQTAWTVDVALPENGTAWWRVQAADPWVDGGWATAESFVVNAVNEEPGQPVAVAPVDVLVQSGTPTLEWVDVSDVDGDAITYTIEVWDSGGTTLLASAAEVPPAEGPNSTWTVDTPLDDDGAFTWRVAAVDEHGLAGPWSADAAFWVNSDNGAPGAVLFTSPSNGDALETLSPALTITATTDMEADTLTYVIEIDTVATFDGPDIDSVTRTEADLTWDLEAEGVALPEHATVYARAWAEDSLGAAGPVETISFFLRGANDPPGVPELVAPIDPSIDTITPTLLVATPIDPEGDDVVLEFRVFADAEGTNEIASAVGVVAGAGGEAAGQTGWTPDVELVGPFWWTARSVDALDAASDWAELAAARGLP